VSREEPEGLRRAPVEAVERRDGNVVVRLAGEIDLYNVAEVSSALAQAGRDASERLVVDLAEVSFLDSTALGALLEAERSLRHETRFLLAGPVGEVRRALEISGLAQRFEIRDTLEDALASEG
jgi:anti-sigma B factor antagonist